MTLMRNIIQGGHLTRNVDDRADPGTNRMIVGMKKSNIVNGLARVRKELAYRAFARQQRARQFAIAAGGIMAALGLWLSSGVGGAIAQVNTPEPPLRLKSDFLGYAFSVSPRVGYTDNIALAPDNDGLGQTILSNLFSASAVVSTPRFSALFSGDLDFSYLVEDSDLVINQSVGGLGTATIVDNFLYLDVGGGSARQLVGQNARFSPNINAARDQQATVNSYTVSPYVYRQFADESVAEVRYRFSQVFVDDVAPGAAAGLLNDSTSHEALASFRSGNLFDRFEFVAQAYGNLTDEEGGIVPFSFDQGTVQFEGRYFLTRRFALSGAFGYDELDTNTGVATSFFDDGDLSGVFWRAGVAVRPGPKSFLRVEYGRRFDDDFIDATAQYQISRRFTFTAGANRSFLTRARSNAEQINILSRSTLDFVDQLREGGEGNPRGIIQQAVQLGAVANNGFAAQTVGVGPTNNAFARLVGDFDRTTIGFNANYQTSDFGFREFDNVTTAFNIDRQLARRVSVYGNAVYQYADSGFDVAQCIATPEVFGLITFLPDFDAETDCAEAAAAEGVTHTLSGTIGMNYRLTSRARAFGQYTRTDRFSGVDLLEYTENAVVVGLVLDF